MIQDYYHRYNYKKLAKEISSQILSLKGIGGLGTEATERFSKSMEPGAKVCRLTPSARYLELNKEVEFPT